MKEIRNPALGAAWFAKWLKHRSSELPLRSIIIGAKCAASLRNIGSQVANYLNEFDSQAEGHWRGFSAADLKSFAEDPACRDLILAENSGDPSESDLARITRRLARVGGAVLEGPQSPDTTGSIDLAFRVCLCVEDPLCFGPCHMWLNPTAFTHESLVSIIADSFLDWTSRQGDESQSHVIGGSQRLAGGIRPSDPFNAAL